MQLLVGMRARLGLPATAADWHECRNPAHTTPLANLWTSRPSLSASASTKVLVCRCWAGADHPRCSAALSHRAHAPLQPPVAPSGRTRLALRLARSDHPRYSIPLSNRSTALGRRASRCQAASGSAQPAPAQSTSVWSAIASFIDQQILPLLLVAMMTLGALVPGPGQAAGKAGLTRMVTVFIFVVAGLQLRRGEAAAALQAWGEISGAR